MQQSNTRYYMLHATFKRSDIRRLFEAVTRHLLQPNIVRVDMSRTIQSGTQVAIWYKPSTPPLTSPSAKPGAMQGRYVVPGWTLQITTTSRCNG